MFPSLFLALLKGASGFEIPGVVAAGVAGVARCDDDRGCIFRTWVSREPLLSRIYGRPREGRCKRCRFGFSRGSFRTPVRTARVFTRSKSRCANLKTFCAGYARSLRVHPIATKATRSPASRARSQKNELELYWKFWARFTTRRRIRTKDTFQRLVRSLDSPGFFQRRVNVCSKNRRHAENGIEIDPARSLETRANIWRVKAATSALIFGASDAAAQASLGRAYLSVAKRAKIPNPARDLSLSLSYEPCRSSARSLSLSLSLSLCRV